MDHGDIFQQAADLLVRGRCFALASVIETVGSTPGKVGYRMLIPDGACELFGTIGGGAVEGEITGMAREMLGRRECRLARYDLETTRRGDKGICGGEVELLIESFDATDAPFFEAVSDATRQGLDATIISILESETGPQKALIADGEVLASTGAGGRVASFDMAAVKMGKRGKVGKTVLSGTSAFVEALAVRARLVIFGAGHLGGFLAHYAGSLGFRVTVVDERPQYANAERLPDADEVIVAEFAEAVQAAKLDRDCYAVVVTRGHACDEVVLERVLRVGPKYVGMIGSRRKTAAILANLRNKGIPQALLDTVYSPIGLAIGAVTPQEIALSIAAELVKVRRAGPDAPLSHLSLSHGGL